MRVRSAAMSPRILAGRQSRDGSAKSLWKCSPVCMCENRLPTDAPCMQSVDALPLRKAKKQLRVLLASHEKSLRDRMAERLGQRFNVEARIDAVDAHEAGMALLVRHPDLVLCDVALPGHVQRGF